MQTFRYINLLPWTLNEQEKQFQYGGEIIRGRVIPCSLFSLKISGYPGIFEISAYNKDFVELDNEERRNNRFRFLLSRLELAGLGLEPNPNPKRRRE